MKRNNSNNNNKSGKGRSNCGNKRHDDVKREQPRKDSSDKRINYDNARESKIEADMKKDNANDISWYSKSPILMQSAGSIPFSSILGRDRSLEIPGILSIPWAPAFGSSDIALNQCANSTYSFLVHANSRNYNYNAPDLGMLIFGGMQPFCMLASIIRAYGTAKAYTEENMYFPDRLLAAQGFQADDVRANLPDMWYSINNFIDQLKQIWIPNVYPILDRWMWLNSEMFTDAEGLRSQTYIYVQSQYLIYDEMSLSTGGCLRPLTTNGEPSTSSWFNPAVQRYTWAVWKKAMQDLIDALVSSEDRGIIYGDILNAYGADKIRAFAPIESNFTVIPRYNAEALMQIENTYTSPISPLGLTQADNQLYPMYSDAFNNKYGGGNPNAASFLYNQVALNYHNVTQPSPEIVTIMTRNINMGVRIETGYKASISSKKLTVAKSTIVRPDACGSEIFGIPTIWTVNSNLTLSNKFGEVLVKQYFQGLNVGGGFEEWSEHHLRMVMNMSSFDWHPAIIMGMTEGTIDTTAKTVTFTSDPAIEGAFLDFDNYSIVGTEVIKRLHDMAMFSLLGVPQI